MSDGEIFELLLTKKNISIKELSELTDIPEQTLYSLKKRKTKRTGKDILAKISKALNVPIDIWNMTPEENLIHQLYSFDEHQQIIDSKNVNLHLQLHNKNLEYIKYALDCIGYNNQYSIDDINDIVNNEIPISKQLANDITYIIEHDCLLNSDELIILDTIRNLSKESKEILGTLLSKLTKSDLYDAAQFKELAHALKKR